MVGIPTSDMSPPCIAADSEYTAAVYIFPNLYLDQPIIHGKLKALGTSFNQNIKLFFDENTSKNVVC